MGGFIGPSGGGGGGGTPSYLSSLAIAAGAKHVWGGGTAPLADLGTGGVNLTATVGGGAAPAPPGGGGVWYRGKTSAVPSGTITADKSQDRSFCFLYTFPGLEAGAGTQTLLSFGAYHDADGLGHLFALESTGKVGWYNRYWVTDAGVDLYSYAANNDKWVIIFGFWDASEATMNLYWRAQDGEEGTATRPGTVEGGGTSVLYLGSHLGVNGVNTMAWAHLSVADGDALSTPEFRAAAYAAMGWD